MTCVFSWTHSKSSSAPWAGGGASGHQWKTLLVMCSDTGHTSVNSCSRIQEQWQVEMWGGGAWSWCPITVERWRMLDVMQTDGASMVSYWQLTTWGRSWFLFYFFLVEHSYSSILVWFSAAKTTFPPRNTQEGAEPGSGGEGPLSWSKSLLIGCQVLFGSLMSLQSFDGVDVLRQLRLPPHQYFVLLQILQTLKAQVRCRWHTCTELCSLSALISVCKWGNSLSVELGRTDSYQGTTFTKSSSIWYYWVVDWRDDKLIINACKSTSI